MHLEETKAHSDSHLLREAWPITAGIYTEVDLSLPSPLFLWGSWHQEAQTPTLSPPNHPGFKLGRGIRVQQRDCLALESRSGEEVEATWALRTCSRQLCLTASCHGEMPTSFSAGPSLPNTLRST